MKKFEHKPKFTSTFLVLMLLVSALLIVLPVAAQDYDYSKTTYAYIGATPNPVGVNQEVLLHVGITDYLYVVSDSWKGLTVTVTDPNGEEQTLGPFKTDSTGGTGAIFVPSMVGTYTFQTHFPAQTYTWSSPPTFDPEFVGTIMYEADDSEILELVVNEDPKQYYSPSSLPNEYWSRPIDGQNREWFTIGGNWVERPANSYAPYNDYAPETPHILWTDWLELGGVAGGATGTHAFDCGDAYEGKFESSVVLGGILFYNKFHSGLAGGPATQEVVAINMHTGETLWQKPLTAPDGSIHRLAFGQVFYFDSFNYHAVFDFLWATESIFDMTTFTSTNIWHAFDPLTGVWQYSIENVPSGSIMFGASTTNRGPNGEILIYNINTAAGWMAKWNSTRVLYGDGEGFDTGSFRPYNQVFDATAGYEYNVTIPTDLSGAVRFITEDKAVGNDVSGWGGIGDEPVNQWCISLEDGDLLWENTWVPPEGDLGIAYGSSSAEDGIFTLQSKETRQVWAFDLENGEEIWGPTDPMPYLGIYGMGCSIAEGKVIVTANMAGTVNAYDSQTGDLIWTYDARDPFNEMLWGDSWPIETVFITDGKVYLGHSEHSPVDPKPRGAPFICLDLDDGTVVWRANGLFRQTSWGGPAVIGDSIIATMDSYDQRIYAIGKGASKTTLSASPKGATVGSSVLLEGMITDISPGTDDIEITKRFPNGVPAVADESMSEWMLYVYKQMNRPTDTKGVTVIFAAVDPKGNYMDIDRTTTDPNGYYSFSFRPELEGIYTIIATFEGTEGYYGSFAQTAVVVDPAHAAATSMEPEKPVDATEPTQAPLITTEIAIVLAVAVLAAVAVVAYWTLRRK
jgi:outer membrane protein assembly factor BamB